MSMGRQLHKLHLDGFGLESIRKEYGAGETVTIRFRLFATDTDYRFFVDETDVNFQQSFDSKGFVFTFIMPDHDVTFHMTSRNSMMAMRERE